MPGSCRRHRAADTRPAAGAEIHLRPAWAERNRRTKIVSKDKKDIVWASRAFQDTSRIKHFTSNTWIEDLQKAGDAAERNERGELLPADRFPSDLYAKYPDKWEKRQPDLFQGGGGWIVSMECADVLRQFDLGKTALYPVKIFQHNRTTPVEGEYYCLAFGETKTAFLPKHSPRVPKRYETVELWILPLGIKNDDLAVSPVALSGPDLWIDPLVHDAFFLSDRLAQALRAAKVSRPFGLRRCRVVHAPVRPGHPEHRTQ